MIRLISKLEKKGTDVKYLDFILQKSIEDLKKEGKIHLDYEMIWKYFDYLKKSNDAIKAVYTLMHVPRMKETAVYLLFVLKKVSEGTITFDSLDENTNEDCDFIKNELIKNFTLSDQPLDEPELEIPEISKSGLSELIKENKFKIKSEEDASVTEEFSEKEMYTEEESTGNYSQMHSDEELELIKAENNEGEEAYDLPGAKEETIEEETDEEIEEVVDEELKEETVEEENNDNPEEQLPEVISKNEIITEEEVTENETIDKSDKEDQESIEREIQEEVNEQEEFYNMPGFEEGFVIKSSLKSEESGIEENEKEPLEETISEDVYDELTDDENELTEEQTEEEKPEDVNEAPAEEMVNESEKETKAQAEEKEVSEQYKKYEGALFEVNELLKEYFLDLEPEKADVESLDGEVVLLAKISELCSMMAGRSEEMSFSIISGIYNDIGDIFNSYIRSGKQPDKPELEKLCQGLELVEALIKGDDFTDADSVMESIQKIQKSFTDQKVGEEVQDGVTSNEHETVKENETTEDYTEQKSNETIKSLKEKFSNAELRESYRVLKTQILELEQTFLSLDEIKGDYQNYEGLRTLSATFINLKEIIRRSKMLDLREAAKLSEASYVFIKFLQNYRMNPFDEDVREILKYIIYNFKLAALDKPSPDIEKFISYLNDPVKIFTQKNKKEKQTVDE